MKKVKYVCTKCKGDNTDCLDCDGECQVKEVALPQTESHRAAKKGGTAARAILLNLALRLRMARRNKRRAADLNWPRAEIEHAGGMEREEVKGFDVKINRFNVVGKDGVKARVHYSLDNRADGRKCVTIYAKDHARELEKVFQDGSYENETDTSTDYFDQGRVILFESHPVYKNARAKVEVWAAEDLARNVAKKLNKHHERYGEGFYVAMPEGGRTRFAGARENSGKLELLEVSTGEWLVMKDLNLNMLRVHDHNGRGVYI